MLSALIPSALSYSAMHLTVQPMHQWCVRPGPLVLRSEPLNFPTPTEDRGPNCLATLMGEQPNPWDLLQPQDATSRHRGAKPRRRYELLGVISLLSLRYLLSVERRQFHFLPPDHLGLLSHLLDLLVSQLGGLMPMHSTPGCQPG